MGVGRKGLAMGFPEAGSSEVLGIFESQSVEVAPPSSSALCQGLLDEALVSSLAGNA